MSPTIVAVASLMMQVNVPPDRVTKAVADKTFQERMDYWNKFRKERWQTGVRLTINVKVEEQLVNGEEDDSIIIDWKLEYRGKRSKLIVLPPSLTLYWDSPTSIIIYAQQESGDIKRVDIPRLAKHEMATRTPPELHVTIAQHGEKKRATSMSLGNIASTMISDSRGLFGKNPPRMFVLLRHVTTDRYGDLDAWTGELYSQAVEVKLNRWPFDKSGGKE